MRERPPDSVEIDGGWGRNGLHVHLMGSGDETGAKYPLCFVSSKMPPCIGLNPQPPPPPPVITTLYQYYHTLSHISLTALKLLNLNMLLGLARKDYVEFKCFYVEFKCKAVLLKWNYILPLNYIHITLCTLNFLGCDLFSFEFKTLDTMKH